MTFEEMGNMQGKTLMLLPGTCCDWQSNFGNVIDDLAQKYCLICVNYDGFDGSGSIFPDVITVTEKIEKYIKDNYGGRIDGALGSSLGGTFVGQLIQRENVHVDHGIFGSSDLDQSGIVAAKLQSMLVTPLLTGVTKSEKKKQKTKKMMMDAFEMSEEVADSFIAACSKLDVSSIKNEYYTELRTHLKDGIDVKGKTAHFIYANKMGEKYKKRYLKYFKNPDIREFDMQHEQWLFGDKKFAIPVLKAIDEFMEIN